MLHVLRVGEDSDGSITLHACPIGWEMNMLGYQYVVGENSVGSIILHACPIGLEADMLGPQYVLVDCWANSKIRNGLRRSPAFAAST